MRAKRGIGTVLVILGGLLIAGAFSLILYNRWDSDRAGKAASEICDFIHEAQNAAVSMAADETSGSASSGPQYPRDKESRSFADDSIPPEARSMATVTIDGNDYIGTISIPDLDIELPVMVHWSYEGLTISPCRYGGSIYTNDLIICAHNFPSHFGPVIYIALGTEVIFTTVDGVEYRYVVSNKETLQPVEIERMGDTEAGDWDLTLFTCYPGGRTRCAVRCSAQD